VPKKKSESTDPQISALSDKKGESFLESGIPEIDELIGGIPRRRIVELWGSENAGKTYTATKMMSTVSKIGKVLYIDSEFALNKERADKLGANLKNIDFIADARLEQVSELIINSVGKYDLIILDSLASLTPLTVATSEVGENAIGLFSRLIKHWVVKFRPLLGTSETAFVAINQYRKPFGLYAKPESPGGTSWHHSVDVRLYLTSNSSDKIVKEGKKIGQWVNIEVKKSRVSQPHATTKFKIQYETSD
jgi:recombination protein RecA